MNDNNKIYQQKQKTCERCAKSKAEVFCQFCSTLKYFCYSCDSSVHSIISYSSHQREELEKDKNVNDLIIQEENNEIKNSENTASSPNQDRQFMSGMYSNRINNSYLKTNNFHKNIDELQRITPISTQYYSGVGSSKKIDTSNSNSFSKDYVNNLKTIFEKEREELIKKNNTITISLERLKSAFNDQIVSLQKQIFEEKEKSQKEIHLLSNENEELIMKLKENYEESEIKKEVMIKELINKLEKTESDSNQYKREVINIREYSDNKIKVLTDKIKSYEDELMRTSTKQRNQIEDINRKNEIEKEDYIVKYEREIQYLSNQYESLKLKDYNEIESLKKKILEIEINYEGINSQLLLNEREFQSQKEVLLKENYELKEKIKHETEINSSLNINIKEIYEENSNLFNILHDKDEEIRQKSIQIDKLNYEINAISNKSMTFYKEYEKQKEMGQQMKGLENELKKLKEEGKVKDSCIKMKDEELKWRSYEKTKVVEEEKEINIRLNKELNKINYDMKILYNENRILKDEINRMKVNNDEKEIIIMNLKQRMNYYGDESKYIQNRYGYVNSN